MRRLALALAASAALIPAAPAHAQGGIAPEPYDMATDGHSALVVLGESRLRIVGRGGGVTRVALRTPAGTPDEVAIDGREAGRTPGYAIAYRRANRAGERPGVLYSALLDRRGRLGRPVALDRQRRGGVVPRIGWAGSGYVVAWLGAEGLVAQRVEDRRRGPRTVVAPAAERFHVAGDGEGGAWIVWSELDPDNTLRSAVVARRLAADGELGPRVVLRSHPDGSRFGAQPLAAVAHAGSVFALVQHELQTAGSDDEVLELASAHPNAEIGLREVARTNAGAGGVRGRLALGRGTLVGRPVVAYRAAGEDGLVRARVQLFARDLTPSPAIPFGIRGGPGAFDVGLDNRAHTIFHERRDMRVASVRLDGSGAPALRRITYTPRAREATSLLVAGRGGRLWFAWSEGNRVQGNQCPREIAFARVLRRNELTPVRRLASCTR